MVVDPEIGLPVGEDGTEIPMLTDVLAVIERLADKPDPAVELVERY